MQHTRCPRCIRNWVFVERQAIPFTVVERSRGDTRRPDGVTERYRSRRLAGRGVRNHPTQIVFGREEIERRTFTLYRHVYLR